MDRFTCRLQPAELDSSSWPAKGSDQSAGWGSGKSSVSEGCFLWPLTTPPGLPLDSHLGGNVREGQQKKTEKIILLSFTTALPPYIAFNKMFLQCLQQEAACYLPCAFNILLLGFLLASLSWFEVLQDEGVRLSAPLRQCAQELKQKYEGH